MSLAMSRWTVRQLAMFEIGIRDAQAWSQLKLQGYFTCLTHRVALLLLASFALSTPWTSLNIYSLSAMWHSSSCNMFRRRWATPRHSESCWSQGG